MRSSLVLLVLLLARALAFAQTVERIYVQPVTASPSLEKARKDLIAQLRKVKSVQLVESPSLANAILFTSGEIYIRGYYSLNPRAGLNPTNGSPVYGGYLSVELKDASGVTMWSYFADTSDSKDAAHELSKKIVRHFAETFAPGNT